MSEYIIDMGRSSYESQSGLLSADVSQLHEEIVRCRDCVKFGEYGKTAKAHWCGYWACYKAKPDGFCAWSCRKESE